MLTLSNPRLSEVNDNWPHGRNRVTATFNVVNGTRGTQKEQQRIERVTTGAPKRTTFYDRMCIVDGDDDRTYLLGSTPYGTMYLINGTMKGQQAYSLTSNDDETRAMAEQIRDMLNAI